MNKSHLLTGFILLLIVIQPITIATFQQQSQQNTFFFQSISQPKIPSFFSTLHQRILPSKATSFDTQSLFQPKNITFIDDAFHPLNQTYGNEWWYFDATFNQRYTLQFSIHVYSVFTTGFATVQCNIYNHTTSIVSERKLLPLSAFIFSERKPFIALNDQPVMNGTQDTKNKPEFYQLTYAGNNYSFHLNFTAITNGWKGTTTAGNWAVVFPKALVTGKLTLQNKTVNVSGIGYHDHNWNVTVSTGRNYGWLWGKTSSNKHVLTWATIFETWYKRSPLLVINQDYKGFINIPAEHIDFSVTDIRFKNGMILPYGFTILAQYKEYKITLSIEIIDSDYITVLGLINYWRYHTHTTGTIKSNDAVEQIDVYDIAEFIRFRPY